jgi:hypothetical protein
LDLGSIIPAHCFKSWKLNFQFWPQDIQTWCNMVSSAWYDIPTMVCFNEAWLFWPFSKKQQKGVIFYSQHP